MESKVLNFPDAMRVAEILFLYKESVQDWRTSVEMLKKISTEDIVTILNVLQDLGWENSGTIPSMKVIIELFQNNDIKTLIEIYSKFIL